MTLRPNVRLIVVGQHGLVASRIYESRCDCRLDIEFLSKSETTGVYGTLDLATPEAFDYSILKPGDTIALLGAISMPDECEKNPDLAKAVNVTGPIFFIEKAVKHGARVLFASSDIVYGECQEPVFENTPTAPVGAYGSMKADVERYFSEEPAFKSLRFSLIYSKEDKFTKYLRSCALNQNTADIFHPIYRRVIHIDDVVEAIKLAVLKWDELSSGCLNLAGPELLSRQDLAEAHRMALWPQLKIATTYPGDDFYKARPKVINMSSNHLEKLLGRLPRSISEAVKMEFQI